MLSGTHGELCHTSTGVLVEKGDEVRLTVAEHGFAPATPWTYHPKITDNAIGDVCDRFPETDIGLLRLLNSITFENNPYFEVATPLAGLLNSSKLRTGQILGVDTFVTGYQELCSVGIRVVRRSQTARTSRPYLAIDQGIYATSTETIRNPQVRDGMCGAPLVLLDAGLRASDDIGGIAGFLCYSDIKGYTSSLLYYAEPADALLANGWSLRGSGFR